MSKQIQRLVDLGLGREAVRGTAQAAATFWVPKIDFDFVPTVENAVDNSGLGVIDARSQSKIVKKLGQGTIGGVVYDKSVGLLLAAALGTWGTTGPVETSVYTHAFTRLNTNAHPSLTVFVKDKNFDEKYAMGMLNQLTINAVVNDYLKWTAGFTSKFGTTTSSTPAYTAENAFLPTQAEIKFATTTAALATASETLLRSLRLTINKNTEDWQDLGSVDPSDIVNKEFSVEGDIEAAFDSAVLRGYVTGGTEMACSITLTNADVTIGTSKNPTLSFELAPMAFTEFSRRGGPGDIELSTLRFNGNFKIADSKTISASLQNTQVSYTA